MEENETKQKAYVICTKTLKELQDIAENLDRYGTKEVYRLDIDRSDMSEEQKRIQAQNRWYKDQNEEFRVRDEQIYSMVKKLAIDKILGGCKKDIKKKLYEDIYNTDLRVVGWITKHTGYDSLNTNVEFDGNDQWKNYNNEKFEYSTDIKEFEELVKNVKSRNSFAMKEDEYVLLENIIVVVRAYQFSDMDKTINKQIDKFIKEELTYCLKKDEVIVPQEYLDKGEEGIKEWRDIKASKNKNNSIEKKILRQAVQDKKAYAMDVMYKVMDAAMNNTHDWSIPSITIDGRWNKQRTQKLVNKILKNKSQQFYIDVDKKEIVEEFKDYWKDILMTAYNNVDKITAEEEDNNEK